MAGKCQVRLMSVKWRQQSWQGRVARQHSTEQVRTITLAWPDGDVWALDEKSARHPPFAGENQGLDGQARLGLDRAEGGSNCHHGDRDYTSFNNPGNKALLRAPFRCQKLESPQLRYLVSNYMFNIVKGLSLSISSLHCRCVAVH